MYVCQQHAIFFPKWFHQAELYSVVIQQDQYLRQLYVSDVSVFSSDMFIFVDETGTDKRNLQRKFAFVVSLCMSRNSV